MPAGVAESKNYAYVADLSAGLQVIDVSNSINCVRVGSYWFPWASGMAVVNGCIYVADHEAGLVVLPALDNVQFTVRADEGTLGTPYAIEAATNVTGPGPRGRHSGPPTARPALRLRGLRREALRQAAQVLPRPPALNPPLRLLGLRGLAQASSGQGALDPRAVLVRNRSPLYPVP